MTKKLIIEILFLSVVISILHSIALEYHFYWTTSWYDVIMHFLGGFLIGLISLLFLFKVKVIEKIKHSNLTVFLLILSFTMVVGLAWELFELFAHLTNVKDDFLDTGKDLIMDAIGATFAFYYIKNKYLNSDEK